MLVDLMTLPTDSESKKIKNKKLSLLFFLEEKILNFVTIASLLGVESNKTPLINIMLSFSHNCRKF